MKLKWKMMKWQFLVIALCNGVRGLKYHGRKEMEGYKDIALCNGVRGLK